MAQPDPAFFESHQDIIPLSRIQDRHFTVVGCGSLGTIMSRILARLGAHRFHLIDAERVHLRHLNREVFSHDQIGENKAAALSFQLQGINPKVRSITTAQPFRPDQLVRGRESIVVLASSDPELPIRALDYLRTWDEMERPAVFVARHTGLIGGYWMADLAREPQAKLPAGVPWLVPTGQETADRRSRIATTAHAVAGVAAQAVVEHLMGRPVRTRVDVDLAAIVRA